MKPIVKQAHTNDGSVHVVVKYHYLRIEGSKVNWKSIEWIHFDRERSRMRIGSKDRIYSFFVHDVECRQIQYLIENKHSHVHRRRRLAVNPSEPIRKHWLKLRSIFERKKFLIRDEN